MDQSRTRTPPRDEARLPSPPRRPPPETPPVARQWPAFLIGGIVMAIFGVVTYLGAPKASDGQQAVAAMHAQVKVLQTELDLLRRQVLLDKERCQDMFGSLVDAVVTGRQLPAPPVVLQAQP